MGYNELTSAQNLADGSQSSSSRGSDYTEIMPGSVPCPSCKGSGMIPKELEGTLVALIPVNDERLKPKRTCIYILIWIAICIFVGSTLMFLFMPRTIILSSNHFPIENIDVGHFDTGEVDISFSNRVNVTSGNYLPIQVLNITSIIISKFQPWSLDVVGRGSNETFSLIGPLKIYRNTKELYFNNTVALKGVIAQYCQTPLAHLTSLYVSLQFDVSVTLRYYYGHEEQIGFSTVQQVCCIPSGNCTSGF